MLCGSATYKARCLYCAQAKQYIVSTRVCRCVCVCPCDVSVCESAQLLKKAEIDVTWCYTVSFGKSLDFGEFDPDLCVCLGGLTQCALDLTGLPVGPSFECW